MMDTLIRDTILAGLSNSEIAELVGMEMRRRDLIGCLFMTPVEGGTATLAYILSEAMLDMGVDELSDSGKVMTFALLIEAATKKQERRIGRDGKDV